MTAPPVSSAPTATATVTTTTMDTTAETAAIESRNNGGNAALRINTASSTLRPPHASYPQQQQLSPQHPSSPFYHGVHAMYPYYPPAPYHSYYPHHGGTAPPSSSTASVTGTTATTGNTNGKSQTQIAAAHGYPQPHARVPSSAYLYSPYRYGSPYPHSMMHAHTRHGGSSTPSTPTDSKWPATTTSFGYALQQQQQQQQPRSPYYPFQGYPPYTTARQNMPIHQSQTQMSSFPSPSHRSINDANLLAHMASLLQRRASSIFNVSKMVLYPSSVVERMILDTLGMDKELGIEFAISSFDFLQQEPIIMQVQELQQQQGHCDKLKIDLDGLVLLLETIRMSRGNANAIQHIKAKHALRFDENVVVGLTDTEFHARFIADIETKLFAKIQSNDDTNITTSSHSSESPVKISFEHRHNGHHSYALLAFSKSGSKDLRHVEVRIDTVFTFTQIMNHSHEPDPNYIIDRIEPSRGLTGQKHSARLFFKQDTRPQVNPGRDVLEATFCAKFESGLQATVKGVHPAYIDIILPPIRTVGERKLNLYHRGLQVSSVIFSFDDKAQDGNGHVSHTELHTQPETKDEDLSLVCDCHGLTLLHFAAFLGFGALCKALVTKCNMQVDVLDNHQCTPLHWAVHNNQRNATLALIEAGASLSHQDISGRTAADISNQHGHSEISKDLTELAKFVDMGVSPVAFLIESHPESLLAMLIIENTAKVEELLSQPPNSRQLNAIDKNLNTPLHLAVNKKFPRIVSLLLSCGASSNVVNGSCDTPLHNAIALGRFDLVTMLVERGANVNLRGNPLSRSPLHVAVYNANLQIVEYLLTKGADCNAKEGPLEQTTLHSAVSLGLQDIASVLVRHNANTGILDRRNKSPLDMAEEEMRIVINKALRQCKKSSDDPTSITNAKTTTQKKKGRKGAKASMSIVVDKNTNKKSAKRYRSSIDEGVMTPSSQDSVESPFTAVDADEEARKLEKSWPAKILLKPSRRKHEHIDFFPPELCSSPYKYDIVVMVPHTTVGSNAIGEKNFRFRILVEVKDGHWDEVVDGVKMMKMLKNKTHNSLYLEVEWRIMFTVCSFHFQRKPFKLQVLHSETPFECRAGGGETDDDDSQTPTTPVTSPVGRSGQILLPQHANSDLSDGQEIIFESRRFWIVARKKKDTYFWATRKFKPRTQNSPDNSSSEPGSPNTPYDVKQFFTNSPFPSAAASSSGTTAQPEMTSLSRIPVPVIANPTATKPVTAAAAAATSTTAEESSSGTVMATSVVTTTTSGADAALAQSAAAVTTPTNANHSQTNFEPQTKKQRLLRDHQPGPE